MIHLIGIFKNEDIISFSVYNLKKDKFVEAVIVRETSEFTLKGLILNLVEKYPDGKFLTDNNIMTVLGAFLKLKLSGKLVKLENGFKDSYQYGFRLSQRLKDKFYVTEEQEMITDELLGSMNYFVDKFNGEYI